MIKNTEKEFEINFWDKVAHNLRSEIRNFLTTKEIFAINVFSGYYHLVNIVNNGDPDESNRAFSELLNRLTYRLSYNNKDLEQLLKLCAIETLNTSYISAKMITRMRIIQLGIKLKIKKEITKSELDTLEIAISQDDVSYFPEAILSLSPILTAYQLLSLHSRLKSFSNLNKWSLLQANIILNIYKYDTSENLNRYFPKFNDEFSHSFSSRLKNWIELTKHFSSMKEEQKEYFLQYYNEHFSKHRANFRSVFNHSCFLKDEIAFLLWQSELAIIKNKIPTHHIAKLFGRAFEKLNLLPRLISDSYLNDFIEYINSLKSEEIKTIFSMLSLWDSKYLIRFKSIWLISLKKMLYLSNEEFNNSIKELDINLDRQYPPRPDDKYEVLDLFFLQTLKEQPFNAVSEHQINAAKNKFKNIFANAIKDSKFYSIHNLILMARSFLSDAEINTTIPEIIKTNDFESIINLATILNKDQSDKYLNEIVEIISEKINSTADSQDSDAALRLKKYLNILSEHYKYLTQDSHTILRTLLKNIFTILNNDNFISIARTINITWHKLSPIFHLLTTEQIDNIGNQIDNLLNIEDKKEFAISLIIKCRNNTFFHKLSKEILQNIFNKITNTIQQDQSENIDAAKKLLPFTMCCPKNLKNIVVTEPNITQTNFPKLTFSPKILAAIATPPANITGLSEYEATFNELFLALYNELGETSEKILEACTEKSKIYFLNPTKDNLNTFKTSCQESFRALKNQHNTLWDSIHINIRKIIGILTALTIITPLILQVVYKNRGGYNGIFFNKEFTKNGRLEKLETQCNKTLQTISMAKF